MCRKRLPTSRTANVIVVWGDLNPDLNQDSLLREQIFCHCKTLIELANGDFVRQESCPHNVLKSNSSQPEVVDITTGVPNSAVQFRTIELDSTDEELPIETVVEQLANFQTSSQNIAIDDKEIPVLSPTKRSAAQPERAHCPPTKKLKAGKISHLLPFVRV